MSRPTRTEQGQKKQKKVYMKRRPSRPCYYCENKEKTIDYKDLDTLNKFQNDRGKILSVKQSSLCAKHQRAVARAIKTAREIGLLPYNA